MEFSYEPSPNVASESGLEWSRQTEDGFSHPASESRRRRRASARIPTYKESMLNIPLKTQVKEEKIDESYGAQSGYKSSNHASSIDVLTIGNDAMSDLDVKPDLLSLSGARPPASCDLLMEQIRENADSLDSTINSVGNVTEHSVKQESSSEDMSDSQDTDMTLDCVKQERDKDGYQRDMDETRSSYETSASHSAGEVEYLSVGDDAKSGSAGVSSPLGDGKRGKPKNKPTRKGKVRKEQNLKKKPKVRRVVCGVCGYRNENAAELRMHRRTHDIPQCPICGKILRHAGNLKPHMRTHTESKTYNCLLCEKVYSHPSNLKKHISEIHEDDRSFQCEICQKRFHRRPQLLEHARRHNGEKPHACDFCGARYVQAHTLVTHIVRHHEELIDLKMNPDHVCKPCARLFTTKFNLKEHQERYHGDAALLKKHACDKCGKAYRRKSKLISHLMTHMEKKPHKCTVCNRGYAYKDDLRRHMRSHTDYDPLSCGICHKSFSKKLYLERHMATHDEPSELD